MSSLCWFMCSVGSFLGSCRLISCLMVSNPDCISMIAPELVFAFMVRFPFAWFVAYSVYGGGKWETCQGPLCFPAQWPRAGYFTSWGCWCCHAAASTWGILPGSWKGDSRYLCKLLTTVTPFGRNHPLQTGESGNFLLMSIILTDIMNDYLPFTPKTLCFECFMSSSIWKFALQIYSWQMHIFYLNTSATFKPHNTSHKIFSNTMWCNLDSCAWATFPFVFAWVCFKTFKVPDAVETIFYGQLSHKTSLAK